MSIALSKDQAFECCWRKGRNSVGIFTGTCKTLWHVFNMKFSSASIKDKWGITRTRVENGSSKVTVGWVVKIPPVLQHQQVPSADVWWVCGGSKLRQNLPQDWYGICTRVMLLSDRCLNQGASHLLTQKRITTNQSEVILTTQQWPLMQLGSLKAFSIGLKLEMK